MYSNTDDLSSRLLIFLLNRVPEKLAPWCEAMLDELAVIDGFWERSLWSVGGALTLVTAWRRFVVRPTSTEQRPPVLTLIAGYHVLFSVVLFAVLTWQLPEITASWTAALPPVLISYAISALPATLGFGLHLGDNSARIGAMLFSNAHAILTLEYVRRGLSHHVAFSSLLIVLDVAIIGALNVQSVRLFFQPSPLTLRLEMESPESSSGM
jgi:hypothetical protein